MRARAQGVITQTSSLTGFTQIADTLLLSPNEVRTIFDTLIYDGKSTSGEASYTFSDSCNESFGIAAFNVQLQQRPPKFALSLRPDNDSLIAPAGRRVQFNLIRDFPGRACLTTVHVAIAHDPDLLTFITTSGAKRDSTSSDGTTDYLTFNLTTGLLGSVTYDVSSAIADSSPLALSVVGFEDTCSEPALCSMSIAATGASIQYLYGCNDSLLKQVMKSGSFFISGITPNPARDRITLTLTGATEGDVAVELFDMLGRRIALSPSASFEYDVHDVVSGIYRLRVSSQGRSATQTILIER
jgi:hypothetical protein